MSPRLSQIDLDQAAGALDPDIEQERRVAIFDLLEANHFALSDGPPGPYRLRLGAASGQLVFDVATDDGAEAGRFQISLGPLRQIVKDYFQICHGYYEAIRTQPPAQIETLDEARRGIHHEGAMALKARLDGKAEVDEATAKRLFTLICALDPAP